jgi:4-hydroxybenzoate polyprenyltransferase
MKKVLILVRPWYWLPAIASTAVGFLYGSDTHVSSYGLTISLFAAGPGLSAFAEVVNDICDRHSDPLGSRKKMWGIPLAGGSGALLDYGLGIKQAYLIAGFCSVTGLITSLLISGEMALIYVVGLLVASAYSVRPLHLKSRGALSFFSHAIGYGPVAFHLGLLGARAIPSSNTILISVLNGLWVGTVGLTADLLDFEDDTRTNTCTFVIKLGRTKATYFILFLAGILLTVAVYFAQPSTFVELLWAVGIILLFILFVLKLWWHRNSPISSEIHGLALVLEILFPFFCLM